MKKIIQGACVGALALIASIAQADVDTCGNLAGSWSGGGSFDSGALACQYTGTAEISGKDTFTAKLHLQKSAGGRFCVATYDMSLTGTCINGALNIDTSEYKIQGTVGVDRILLDGKLVSPIEGDLSIAINKNS